MMTNPIAKSSDAQIQTPKRGTNTHTTELLSTDKLPEAQKIESSTNTPQATRIPYHHLKSPYDWWQSQEGKKKVLFLQTNKLPHWKSTKTKSTTCMEAYNEKFSLNNRSTNNSIEGRSWMDHFTNDATFSHNV